MSNIREVSSLAGVSISTVSRVLNDSAPVSQDTKKRVLDAVRKLEYHPNTFARSLVTKRSGCLAVTVSSIKSPFFGGLIQGIEHQATQAGMHLTVSSGHALKTSERNTLTLLQQRRPDALIAQIEALTNTELRSLLTEKVPTILVGRYLKNFPCVYFDNEAGALLATNYLLNKGHKRIAHLSGPLHLPDGSSRLQGYQKALQQAHRPYDPTLVIEGNFSELGGLEKTKELITRTKDFTALFAANDQMAAGALRALREAGLRVPEDVSIIGFDDIETSKFLSPLLTTVRQPFVEMGQAAVEIALALITEQETEEVRKFEPQLTLRESVSNR
jgi:LacI family transcriptional regulator